MSYPDVDPQPDFPALEERILDRWQRTGAFQASIDQRDAGVDGDNEFVFYDGPPFIHPCCYEFGAGDLASIPHAVSSTTTTGLSALDVPATVSAQLAVHGIDLDVIGACTGCDERWFSHRVRAERARHAVVAWWEQP